MTALELQMQLANTAHQREVADLQAAGLNPVLSAANSGAAVPNIMNGDSATSGATSARAIAAAGRANPLNKALDIIEGFVDPRLSNPKPNPPFNRGSSEPELIPNNDLSFNEGIPSTLSSYANSMANVLVPAIAGTIASGIGGPAAGVSAASLVSMARKALQPLQKPNRNSAVAVLHNQNIHDADYARSLLRRK